MENRKIIHVDMDAFFASVEQLDFPEYRNKPLAVGGNSERGVIAAASYEARKFGVKSAMSSKMAAKMCPDLIFARPRFERYKEISKEIRKIFERYTDLVEPLSMDEAFLDVTENKLNIKSATFIAQAIKNDIKNELNLIASAGVSYNKFLAKMASDQDKPDGLFIINEKDALDFVFSLPIHRFFGVGKVTADKMIELGIPTGKQLNKQSLEFLTSNFGKSGFYFYNIARGIDNREVESSRERKSIAVESTFFKDISDKFTFEKEAKKIAKNLWIRYSKFSQKGKTLSLKIKFNDFTINSKSKTIPQQISSEKILLDLSTELIDSVFPLKKPIRLIGFQISGFKKDDFKESYYQSELEF
ncbi:MAG: DNA polymerase IV [Bacteroidota bacterium]